jgi:hypothetical protein
MQCPYARASDVGGWIWKRTNSVSTLFAFESDGINLWNLSFRNRQQYYQHMLMLYYREQYSIINLFTIKFCFQDILHAFLPYIFRFINSLINKLFVWKNTYDEFYLTWLYFNLYIIIAPLKYNFYSFLILWVWLLW